jgi:hypothetical protein
MPWNIMGFCAACDLKVEDSLPLSLSEFCDCDQYTRWICLPCKVKEDCMERKYLQTRTKAAPGDRHDAQLAEIYEGLWQSEVLDITGVRILYVSFYTMLIYVVVLVPMWEKSS